MIMQRQFQQFLDRMVDFPVACRSWYRKVHTVLSVEILPGSVGEVLDAPVVVQQQVPWLGSRNAWFDDGYMLCVILGGFWKIYDFLREGADSAPELPSGRHIVDNGSGMFHTCFAGIDAPRAVFP